MLRRSARAGAGRRRVAAAPRRFASPTVELYQYEICPYCSKVKAFLDWQQIEYRTVEVNPLTKAQIRFSQDFRKVPIALIDGEQVNDSSQIIYAVAEKISSELTAELADEKTQEWMRWCDEEFAAVLSPNLTRSLRDSWQAFRYVTEVPTFSVWGQMSTRATGALGMWLANGGVKRARGITDDRGELRACVREWLDAVGSGPFVGGAKLGAADVVVYGVLSSMRGLRTHTELMAAIPELVQWDRRVYKAVGRSCRIEHPPVMRMIGPAAVHTSRPDPKGLHDPSARFRQDHEYKKYMRD